MVVRVNRYFYSKANAVTIADDDGIVVDLDDEIIIKGDLRAIMGRNVIAEFGRNDADVGRVRTPPADDLILHVPNVTGTIVSSPDDQRRTKFGSLTIPVMREEEIHVIPFMSGAGIRDVIGAGRHLEFVHWVFP